MSFLDAHTTKFQEALDGCWHWQGAHVEERGQVTIKGKRRLVANIVCEEENGPRPDGHEASHTRNTRQCVRPSHLVWETPAQNHARRKAKGHYEYRPGGYRARYGRTSLGLFDSAEEAEAAYARHVKDIAV